MEFFLADSHFNLMDILVLFIVCFLSSFIFYILKVQSQTNVSFFRRMNKWRFNCLAILYQEIRDARLSGTQEKDIQALMKEKCDKKAFPFMLHGTNSPKQLKDLAFIEQLINNKEALLRFASTPTFGKKEYNAICCLIGDKEKEKKARNAVFTILKDKSKQSVDSAMIWLPKLLTEPFVEAPESSKKPKAVENTYTIFYLFKGTFFDECVTVEEYKKTISLLKQVYPNINISLSGHSSDWANYTMDTYPRGKVLLGVIQGTLASTRT